MRGKNTLYVLLVTAALLVMPASALADDNVYQENNIDNEAVATNEVGNAHARFASNTQGMADVTCQWAILLNQKLFAWAEGDSLGLLGSSISEGGIDDLFRPTSTPSGYDQSAEGEATCDTVLRNIKIQASLAEGFGLQAPEGDSGLGGFTGGGDGGFFADDDDVDQSNDINNGASSANFLGNGAVDIYGGINGLQGLGSGVVGSSFARCQWLVAVNTVMVGLSSANAGANAQSDIERDLGLDDLFNTEGVSKGGSSVDSEASCSTVIDNFELVVDMDAQETASF